MQTNRRLSVSRSGISLLEVLAAIFVVSIGLLGVLAVIPFGAFQISRAQHAEYAANMLANAAEEVVIRNLENPARWGVSRIETNVETLGNVVVRQPVQVTLTVTQSIVNRFIQEPSSSGWFTETVSVPDPDDPGETITIPIRYRITYNITYEVEWVSTRTLDMIDTTRFFVIDPREMDSPPQHLFCIGGTPPFQFQPIASWQEWMRGQDDLVYSTYADKRPDFVGQNNKMQSSGKYTWFFTFRPNRTLVRNQEEVPLRVRPPNGSVVMVTNPPISLPPMPLTNFPPTPPWERVPWDSRYFPPTTPRVVPGSVGQPTNVQYVYQNPGDVPAGFAPANSPTPLTPTDQSYPLPSPHHLFTHDICPGDSINVLACYNRVSEDDRWVRGLDPYDPTQLSAFSPSRRGGTFTFPNSDHLERLAQTRYVFVTWGQPNHVAGGVWCRVVFVDRDERSNSPPKPKVIVTGDLPDLNLPVYENIQIYIPSGVLYHKPLENVPIW